MISFKVKFILLISNLKTVTYFKIVLFIKFLYYAIYSHNDHAEQNQV